MVLLSGLVYHRTLQAHKPYAKTGLYIPDCIAYYTLLLLITFCFLLDLTLAAVQLSGTAHSVARQCKECGSVTTSTFCQTSTMIMACQRKCWSKCHSIVCNSGKIVACMESFSGKSFGMPQGVVSAEHTSYFIEL